MIGEDLPEIMGILPRTSPIRGLVDRRSVELHADPPAPESIMTRWDFAAGIPAALHFAMGGASVDFVDEGIDRCLPKSFPPKRRKIGMKKPIRLPTIQLLKFAHGATFT